MTGRSHSFPGTADMGCVDRENPSGCVLGTGVPLCMCDILQYEVLKVVC